MNGLPLETLEQRIAESELGQQWLSNPLINKDIWSILELGYTEEESKANLIKNVYFDSFSLPWLKLLTKLTVLATARAKNAIATLRNRIGNLKQLDKFLVFKGYSQPETITDNLLQEFITQGASQHRKAAITYAIKLWREEQWLRISFTHSSYKKTTPKIEIIPEEVLYQIYENFDLFPPPIERLFRLQLILGYRIGEMLRIPRQCLKKEGDKWFFLRWVEKRKHWQFYEIHPLVAALIIEQQKFLDTQFGCDSDFDKLFCKVTVAKKDGADVGGRFKAEPIYLPELLLDKTLRRWLIAFRDKADLKDKYGNRFELTSHMFRRTKASIMAYCNAEDEYIAAILGHGSLDMLPHYRKRSLEQLEKEVSAKGYVDKYGNITSFKPRKLRYEKLAEILKVDTPLGECHRPTMLGDCQYRYACLSCDHHRVMLEDKPKLEADLKNLQQDLEQSEIMGQERRVTEIKRLLKLLQVRLQGLKKLKIIQGDEADGKI